MRRLVLAAVLLLLSNGDRPAGPPACAVTATVRATPPDDPETSPFGDGPWYRNANHRIWAHAFSDSGSWHAGTDGNKVIWIRQRDAKLRVAGHRIDGDSPPMRADLPGGYLYTLQISALYFPRAGCWEMAATTGADSLRFVTLVR